MSISADWFRSTFGVKEKCYHETKADFVLRGNTLVCLPSQRTFHVGTFKDASLAELQQAAVPARPPGAERYLIVKAEAAEVTLLQADPANRFATFQVSSVPNYLAMSSPEGKPENGVTTYYRKKSQGAACAISCAAALMYRNYFAPVQRPDGSWQAGQTSACMLNGLTPLLEKLDLPPDSGFRCKGGYTITTDEGLRKLNKALGQLEPGQAQRLVKVGLHEDVQVTSKNRGQELCTDVQQVVTQVFTPACSISWNPGVTLRLWEPLVKAVLRAAYEATLWAAVRSAQRHWGRGGSTRVFLTMVGGGGFGTPDAWICEAMGAALWKFRGSGLRVFVVLHDESVPGELYAVLDCHQETM